ncbi:MAG: thioredoxin domain-containing protein [Armatimonadota bacterium]|nr:thioredoxin domain-containing protein [Armatimonadota bacterium]
MSRVTANRIVFVLASIGAFIALVTGIAHAAGAQLPCGGTASGCDVISQRENSHFMGVPIAFYGLALYLFVAFLAMFRAAIGIETSPKLGSGMWAMLAAGSLVSVGLMTHAFVNLHATCYWCLASAVTILATFFVHTYGTTAGKDGGKQWPFGAFMAVLSLAVVGGTLFGFSLRGQASPTIEMAKQDRPAYDKTDVFMGSENAPVVITEFTDLYCPTCRSQHAWLMSQISDEIDAGKIKLIVRHYPLPNLHPLAVQAAMFAIWAQEEGKFWEFFNAAHRIEDPASEDELLEAIRAAGLDVKVAKELLANKGKRTPYVTALQKDIDDGTKLSVEATPSWIVDYSNGTREFSVGSGIQRLVANTPFQTAIR